MYTINADLDELSSTAVQQAVRHAASEPISAPGAVARGLATAWSFCVWNIAGFAGCPEQVAKEFRNRIIGSYLAFILKLGWEPGEICFGPGANDSELNDWRDLFLSQLKDRFRGSDSVQQTAVSEAMKSLDHGKRYVSQGYDWLEKELSSVFGRGR